MIKKFFLTVTAVFSLPLLANAASHAYVPLVDLGGRFAGGDGDLGQYFNNLFDLALIIGSVLAVLLIATAGLQYMTTDAVSGTTQAKTRIRQAVMGILMLLAIWIFFNEVNPEILDLNFALSEFVVEESKTPAVKAASTIIPVSLPVGSTITVDCDLPGKPSCSSVISTCTSAGAGQYPLVHQITDSTVVCSSTNSVSEYKHDIVVGVADDLIAAGELEEVAVYYDHSDLNPLEVETLANGGSIDTNGDGINDLDWNTPCEARGDSYYIDFIQDASIGVGQWACVSD